MRGGHPMDCRDETSDRKTETPAPVREKGSPRTQGHEDSTPVTPRPPVPSLNTPPGHLSSCSFSQGTFVISEKSVLHQLPFSLTFLPAWQVLTDGATCSSTDIT